MGSESGKIEVSQGMDVGEGGHTPAEDLEAANAPRGTDPSQGQAPEDDAGIYTQAELDARQVLTTESNEPFDEFIDLCVLERQDPHEAPTVREVCP